MTQQTHDPETFDAQTLKAEMRPPELWTPEDGYKDDWSADDRDDFVEPPEDEALLPHPVLDPSHGEIRVVNDYAVQVFTDEDVYHELVQWLDEVFDVPVGYEVYWVDLKPAESNIAIETHALIVLREDDEVYEHSEDAGPQVFHEYKRGDYAGEHAEAYLNDGGLQVFNGVDYEFCSSPSKAAQRADEIVRGDDATEGKNGWTWWVVGDDDFELDDLRR